MLRARLLQEKRKNLNLLTFFEDYPVLEIRASGESVLVRGRSDRDWFYVSSSSKSELASLAQTLEAGDRGFAAIEDWMLPVLVRNKPVAWILSTDLYILPDQVLLPQPEHPWIPLSEADAATVYESSDYKEYLTPEYVLDRIRRGFSASIRIEDRPAAWIMTQDDGAMGFLHVLESHRNRGYARSLTTALAARLRSAGKLPFACIEEENHASVSLFARQGFVREKRIHWVLLA